MIKINIISNKKTWYRYLNNPSKFIQNKTNKLNKKIKIYKKKVIYCTLLLTGEKEIKKLNKKFRKKNKSTDILSFPNYDSKEIKKKLGLKKNIYLGDIAINLYKVNRKKNNFKKNFNKLWIHGLVHLLGYKHYKNKDFYNMKRLEDKIINQLKC